MTMAITKLKFNSTRMETFSRIKQKWDEFVSAGSRIAE
jgi:hypothetical protein